MTIQELQQRSDNTCELCGATEQLSSYEVSMAPASIHDNNILACATCIAQIDKKADLDKAHWENALPTAMWSEFPAVQVQAWRMLNRFRDESWAADSIDMMYLDEEHLNWAKATGDHENDATVDLHRDCNGAQLFAGDTVVLTRSLDVKGSSVNAALGTVVKNIKLDPNDTGYIEGKIEGQSIMIKTIYVRKQGAEQMA